MGPPVEGDDFFGRANEINYVWSKIEAGNNFIFPSPRRVGKTSFALKLLEIAKNKDWNIISLNLEGIPTEQKFVEEFVEKLKELSWWEQVKENGSTLFKLIKSLKPSVGFEGVKVDFDWKEQKQDIYNQLENIINHQEPTLIFFDELTVLLKAIADKEEDGKKEVTNFLHWLRRIRTTNESNIRWIFCSSVGIENFTHSYGISDTINDVPDYKLKAFNKAESKAMLTALCINSAIHLDDDLQETIVNKLVYCIPYFLQITFEKIEYYLEVEGLPLNNSTIDIAYESLTEGKHFNTWIERIDEQYGILSMYAFALLKHICKAKEGVTRQSLVNVIASLNAEIGDIENLLAKLLYMLTNDGYLIEEDGIYQFRSPLLRDFWFKRFVK